MKLFSVFPPQWAHGLIARTRFIIQFWDNPFLGSNCLPPILWLWRQMQKSLKSPEYGRLVELLVAVRHSAGFQQQKLAAKLRKPQSFVAKYEGGERRIDLIEFIAITRALGADPVKLFGDFVAGKPGPKVRRKGPAK
jgi:hypothetical protein